MVPWLYAYRIIQEDPRSIRLQIVPKQTLKSTELDALVKRASEIARGELNVVPEVLNKSEFDRTGKMRTIIHNLQDKKSANGHSDAAKSD